MNTDPRPKSSAESIGPEISSILHGLRSRPAPEQEAHDAEFDDQQRRIKIEELRGSWNAPKRHATRTDFDPDATGWREACDKLLAKVGTGFTVGLAGVRGPGKTQIGVELMRRATAQLRPAYYCTAMDYYAKIKDSFGRNAELSQEDAQKFFVKPRLLVIDEMHVRSDSAWEDNMLTDLIGKRYNAMVDTVLISNQTVAQFASSVGPSILDRIGETGGMIECNWPSFRQ